MHWVMASLVPDTVTARSVELGSISLATTTEAPVISRISLILEPPLPMSEPHCDAGMMSRSVMGGRGMAVPASGPPTSCNRKQKLVNHSTAALRFKAHASGRRLATASRRD